MRRISSSGLKSCEGLTAHHSPLSLCIGVSFIRFGELVIAANLYLLLATFDASSFLLKPDAYKSFVAHYVALVSLLPCAPFVD